MKKLIYFLLLSFITLINCSCNHGSESSAEKLKKSTDDFYKCQIEKKFAPKKSLEEAQALHKARLNQCSENDLKILLHYYDCALDLCKNNKNDKNSCGNYKNIIKEKLSVKCQKAHK
jgi:hypothetical protein